MSSRQLKNDVCRLRVDPSSSGGEVVFLVTFASREQVAALLDRKLIFSEGGKTCEVMVRVSDPPATFMESIIQWVRSVAAISAFCFNLFVWQFGG